MESGKIEVINVRVQIKKIYPDTEIYEIFAQDLESKEWKSIIIGGEAIREIAEKIK